MLMPELQTLYMTLPLIKVYPYTLPFIKIYPYMKFHFNSISELEFLQNKEV